MFNFLQLDHSWRRLRLAMALLAMTVVGWGLHYKLTLYVHSVGAHAGAPAAKLLSQKERAVQDEGTTVRSPEPPAELQVVLCVARIGIVGLLCHSPLEVFALNKGFFDVQFEKLSAIRPPPAPSLS